MLGSGLLEQVALCGGSGRLRAPPGQGRAWYRPGRDPVPATGVAEPCCEAWNESLSLSGREFSHC